MTRMFALLQFCPDLKVAFIYVLRQWLEDALKENDPTSVQLFLVGTKKDLSVRGYASEHFCVLD